MGILLHTAALAPFICLFFLSKLTFRGYGKLAHALRRAPASDQHLCKFSFNRKDFPVTASDSCPEVL